jgi:DNA-binding response OmpR family regulator
MSKKKNLTVLFVSDDENLNPIFYEDDELDPDIKFEVINHFDIVLDFIQLFKVDAVILTNLGLLPGEMPRVVKSIRADFPELPIIVLCSIDKPEFISRLAECGADTFFKIPFDLDLLFGRIKELVGLSK